MGITRSFPILFFSISSESGQKKKNTHQLIFYLLFYFASNIVNGEKIPTGNPPARNSRISA